MILSLLSFVAVIIATYHVYKTAKSYNRNAVLWAVIALVVGIGFQFVIPLFIGIILGIVWIVIGIPIEGLQSAFETWAILLQLICIALSFVGLWLILRQVSKIPEDEPAVSRPPPPPTFGENL